MAKSHKVLLIMFSILLAVTILEIVYYFLFLPNTKPTNQNASTPPQNQPISNTAPDQGQAIDENVLATLREFREGVLVDYQLKGRFEGEIAEIEKDSNGINNSQVKFKFAIKGENGLQNVFTFYDADLNRTTFYQLENGGSKEITIEDIQNGDQIIMEPVYQLVTKNRPAAMEITITKK